jgi:hypothetical protein
LSNQTPFAIKPIRTEDGPGPQGSPVAFSIGGTRLAVEAVLDRWPGADHLYLKIRAADGGCYILRREDTTGRWQVQAYHGPGPGNQPPLSGTRGPAAW